MGGSIRLCLIALAILSATPSFAGIFDAHIIVEALKRAQVGQVPPPRPVDLTKKEVWDEVVAKAILIEQQRVTAPNTPPLSEAAEFKKLVDPFADLLKGAPSQQAWDILRSLAMDNPATATDPEKTAKKNRVYQILGELYWAKVPPEKQAQFRMHGLTLSAEEIRSWNTALGEFLFHVMNPKRTDGMNTDFTVLHLAEKIGRITGGNPNPLLELLPREFTNSAVVLGGASANGAKVAPKFPTDSSTTVRNRVQYMFETKDTRWNEVVRALNMPADGDRNFVSETAREKFRPNDTPKMWAEQVLKEYVRGIFAENKTLTEWPPQVERPTTNPDPDPQPAPPAGGNTNPDPLAGRQPEGGPNDGIFPPGGLPGGGPGGAPFDSQPLPPAQFDPVGQSPPFFSGGGGGSPSVGGGGGGGGGQMSGGGGGGGRGPRMLRPKRQRRLFGGRLFRRRGGIFGRLFGRRR